MPESACVWSAFDNYFDGPRWATIASNGVIVVVHVRNGEWEGHFTDRNGGNAVIGLGLCEQAAKQSAVYIAENI
jgi:hypothetical protein